MHQREVMKKRTIISVLLASFACLSSISATPSKIFWTPCTTEVYDQGLMHIDVDNYFTVFQDVGHGSILAPDVGLEFGLFTYKNLKVEGGVDFLGGTDYPLMFNFKVGLEENMFTKWMPSASIGMYNMGTKRHGHKKTDQDIVNFVLGKTLPWIDSHIYFGIYHGNDALGSTHGGWMTAWDYGFYKATDSKGGTYNKWWLAADYASGKNAIGGGGAGIAYFFTPDINLLTGPVFFRDREFNGRWKWSVQLNINACQLWPSSFFKKPMKPS